MSKYISEYQRYSPKQHPFNTWSSWQKCAKVATNNFLKNKIIKRKSFADIFLGLSSFPANYLCLWIFRLRKIKHTQKTQISKSYKIQNIYVLLGQRGIKILFNFFFQWGLDSLGRWASAEMLNYLTIEFRQIAMIWWVSLREPISKNWCHVIHSSVPGFVLTLIYPWGWIKSLQIVNSSWWLSLGFFTCCLTGCHQRIPHLTVLFFLKWLTKPTAEKCHPFHLLPLQPQWSICCVKSQWWNWQAG